VFGDMQLIARLYEPDVAILPIGGYFTMDPREAAVAIELLGTTRCVPCHYGTFPALSGTPDELRKLAPSGVEIISPEPGETIEL
jgi:L-ascorbate metabolism protein UlaG (beta-lactamase superfamily)